MDVDEKRRRIAEDGHLDETQMIAVGSPKGRELGKRKF
mgnify:CR=1 FL=1